MDCQKVQQASFFWALQALCVLHRKPFSAELAQQQIAAPHTISGFLRACVLFDFDAALQNINPAKLHKQAFPLVIWLRPPFADGVEPVSRAPS